MFILSSPYIEHVHLHICTSDRTTLVKHFKQNVSRFCVVSPIHELERIRTNGFHYYNQKFLTIKLFKK